MEVIMKKTLISILFILTFSAYSQDKWLFENVDILYCKRKTEIKRIQKRFDKAVIWKDYYGERNNYYMELEEDDIYEYNKRLGIKFYCIPKRKRKNIHLTMLFYEEGEFNRNNTFEK